MIVVILEVADEEATVILDGLAALPLSRSYNAFNKVYKQVEEQRRKSVSGPDQPGPVAAPVVQ